MLKKQKKLACYKDKALTCQADINNGCEHAIKYQLFLCAYLHGKRVMPLACERVKTYRVRAFTLFPEIPWRDDDIISRTSKRLYFVRACRKADLPTNVGLTTYTIQDKPTSGQGFTMHTESLYGYCTRPRQKHPGAIRCQKR